MPPGLATGLACLAVLLLAVIRGPLRAAQVPWAAVPLQIQALEGQRYRLGAIEIDLATARFLVSGVVLRQGPPLEFLAVTRGGVKGYESLLELDANAYEFNLTCLLIGLEPQHGTPPRYHFDPEPTQGDLVDIWVSWDVEGQTTQVDAADLLQLDGHTLPRGEWVYTGSVVLPDGRYLAQLDGTLVGFVHDPASVIEHRSGFGLGRFGAVHPNPALLPPVGTRVQLLLARRPKR